MRKISLKRVKYKGTVTIVNRNTRRRIALYSCRREPYLYIACN